MTFLLNGSAAEIPADLADDRLLFVLRDHFALDGPKYGCGVGACGACTVHVDGGAERACLMAARDVDGRAVTTLEGLGAGHADGLHPVQRAFLDARVPQCGYCQNGQVMSAAALLAAHPAAGRDAVAAAMDGIVCRCGTYARVRTAVARAQAAMTGGAG
ncbi:MAG: (2Fe-2S)-binding protein [Salinarimonas sp.]